MGLGHGVLFGAAIHPLFWFPEPILLALGQDPQVAALAGDCLWIAGLGVIPALLVVALLSFLAALERTRVVLWATLAGVALNAAPNWALILGSLAAFALGVRGAAVASVALEAAARAAPAGGQPSRGIGVSPRL